MSSISIPPSWRRIGDGIAKLTTQDLIIDVVDNRPFEGHHSGLNGIMSFIHREQGKDIVAPTCAILNQEALSIDGMPQDKYVLMMAPRANPMTLYKIDKNSVALYMPPTFYQKFEGLTVFKARNPYYLDFDVTYVLHKKVLEKANFWISWACYINNPHDPSIYLMARRKSEGNTYWYRGLLHTHGGGKIVTGRHIESFTNILLQRENSIAEEDLIPNYDWAHPFYYGLIDGYAFILMFTDHEGIEIGYGRHGGWLDPSVEGNFPAWDFIYGRLDYQIERPYRFKGCLAYKKFLDREDVLEEYKKRLKSEP